MVDPLIRGLYYYYLNFIPPGMEINDDEVSILVLELRRKHAPKFYKGFITDRDALRCELEERIAND